MLRLNKRTVPLLGDGIITLLKCLLQIGDLGEGRLQLIILGRGRLLVFLAAVEL